MPIPILLAGLGIAAGVIGASGHISAKETNEKAQSISSEAQRLYNQAKRSLEIAQKNTEDALLQLGYSKKNVLETSMNQFLVAYDKVKHIQMKESEGLDEISKFAIDQQGAIQIREMTDIYSNSFASSATGAATGAVIALAASGALPIITGELAVAGTMLAAGNVGVAAGIAGSALSFGAAMTPLAAVAAPVLLFTGLSASMKADENLEKANTMYAEAEAAVEKMKVSMVLCEGIIQKAEMYHDLLNKLNCMFAKCSGILAGVIKKKEGRFIKKDLSSADFSEDELQLIAVSRALAGAVKAIIDTPILSQEGQISKESEQTYDNTIAKLPHFEQAVQKVSEMEFNSRPVVVKQPSNRTTTTTSTKSKTGLSVLQGSRNVVAVLMGLFLAITFGSQVASVITDEAANFLFFSSYTANKFAIWLLIFSSVTMLIGKDKDGLMSGLCELLLGVSTSILYVQYCRSVEDMNHYIIFTVIFMGVCVVLASFIDEKWSKFNFGVFFKHLMMYMAIWGGLFLSYAFFSKFLGFSESFWLVLTTICYIGCLKEAFEDF